MSYTDFHVTYIHNKFWGLNSIKVPKQRVVLNKNWLTTEQLFKTENQRYYFDIFWEEYMVGGEVLIPGEWNYAYYNGKFFHLEKTKSAGFIDDQESFYYTLIYDDWQNDWLTNNVNLCGTINLTGDQELVKQHLVQTTPLLNNVNNYRYLNGKRYVGEDLRVILPIDNSKWIKESGLSSLDYITINEELQKLNLGEPNRDKLVIPFLYRTTPKRHWKWLIIKAIKDLERKKIGVYDVDQSNSLRPTLQVKFNTNELYTITTTDNSTRNYAKTLNRAKYIEEIDLTGFIDLVQLHPTTLSPEYTTPESQTKFSIRSFCEKIRSRFNWPQNLIPYMEDIVTRVFAIGLGDLIDTEVNPNRKKIFKNVTVTPINRDVDWNNLEEDLIIKNPEWLTRIDSLIPNHKFYRNFIFSNDDLKDEMFMFTGLGNWKNELTGIKSDKPINAWLHSEVDDRSFNSWLEKKYLPRTKVNEQSRSLYTWLEQESVVAGVPFKILQLCRTKGVQLVLPTHTHKLVEEGDEGSTELDFTRTDWFNDTTLLLVPDYERKTHVLSIRCPINVSLNKDRWELFFDDNDNLNPLRGEPIYPYVTTELFEVKNTTVEDSYTRPKLLQEWRRNLSNNPNQAINPVASLYHFADGTYMSKYKHYNSYCSSSGCAYDRWEGDTSYGLHKLAFSIRWYLTIPYLDDDTLIPQVEIVLPYSESLIILLKEYGVLSDYIFRWRVINSNEGKGKVLNPLVYKNEGIFRMNNDELASYGTKDIVVININPTIKTLKPNDDYSEDWWYQYIDMSEVDTNRVYSEYWTKQGGGARASSVYDTVPFQLFSKLLRRFYEDKYWPMLDDIKTEDLDLVIPLRIYPEKNPMYTKWFNPSFITGMVKPYAGFNYLCCYRFIAPLDKERSIFSSTSTPFNFDNKPHFIMVIPDTYANSGRVIPHYTYREPITQLTRESNIAFLVNGGWYDTSNQKRHLWGGWSCSNTDSQQGWAEAEIIHERMNQWVNQRDIFFEEFIKKQHTTNRTSNPTILKNEYYYDLNGRQSFNITTLDNEIPPFMVKYLDPDKKLSSLFEWKTSTAKTDVDRLNELRNKLTAAITDLKVKLATENTWFQLKGTDWYVSVKLNFQDTTTWDFELFTTKPRLIKSRTTDTWKFEYHNEEDVDVLINTSNELTLYGKRISQKSRYTSDTDELDLRLKITPLDDPKQTVTSSWYKVEMKTDDQDLIRDIIEIPKEQVRTSDFSVFQREQIFREIELKAAERNSEAQLLEISRDRFKQKDYFEEVEVGRRLMHRGSHAGLDIAFGLTKAMPGWGDLVTGDFSKSISGLEQAARGAVDLVDATWEYRNTEIDRKARFAIGVREFDIKGARMQQQHLTNRANDMSKLSQMSARIQYPQMNSGLIYREFNKSEGLNDVYITQYYPSGKLLKYIKEYYKEYGYEILVRDYTCIGVHNIKRHLRYSNIFRNEHTNIRVKAMIEARALNGIFVSDTEVFW